MDRIGILLSRKDAYRYLGKFIAAEITTTVRDTPVEVNLGRSEGLPARLCRESRQRPHHCQAVA